MDEEEVVQLDWQGSLMRELLGKREKEVHVVQENGAGEEKQGVTWQEKMVGRVKRDDQVKLGAKSCFLYASLHSLTQHPDHVQENGPMEAVQGVT